MLLVENASVQTKEEGRRIQQTRVECCRLIWKVSVIVEIASALRATIVLCHTAIPESSTAKLKIMECHASSRGGLMSIESALWARDVM